MQHLSKLALEIMESFEMQLSPIAENKNMKKEGGHTDGGGVHIHSEYDIEDGAEPRDNNVFDLQYGTDDIKKEWCERCGTLSQENPRERRVSFSEAPSLLHSEALSPPSYGCAF